MSDKKQTFIDPKTGEEIEITPFSKFIAWFGLTTVPARMVYKPFLLSIILLMLLLIGRRIFFFIPIVWWLLGLVGSVLMWGSVLAFTFFGAFAIIFDRWRYERENILRQDISRWQHFRRQRQIRRKLLEEEWAGVPATALTRVDRSEPPQPTDNSLTQAGDPAAAKPRLTESVDEKSVGVRRGVFAGLLRR